MSQISRIDGFVRYTTAHKNFNISIPSIRHPHFINFLFHNFCFLIYVFFYLQFFGLCVLSVGFWAINEKDKVSNGIAKLTHLALDPAFILIIVGIIIFVIGFTGCVGALRENTCLLSMVSLVRFKSI